jgi:hypothetical protein
MEEIVLITEDARRVKGYDGYVVTRNGVVYSMPRKQVKKLRVMKPVANMKADYLRVALSKNGRQELVYIHRIVAEAYIDNQENKPVVNHINGIQTDNRVENLEWCTYQENTDHAFLIGLKPTQKVHSSQKKEIYELVRQGVPIKSVAEMYGMKPGGVRSLVRRYKPEEQRMAA